MDDIEFFERVARTLVTYQLIDEKARAEIAALMEQKHLEFEHALYQAAKVELNAY